MHGLETIQALNANAAGAKSKPINSGLYTVIIEEHTANQWGPSGPIGWEFTQLHVVEVTPIEYGCSDISKLTGPDWATMAQAEATDGERFDHYRLILVVEDGIVPVDIDGDDDGQDA